MNTCELLNTWTVMKSSDSLGLFLYIAHRWRRCWYHLLQHPLPAPDQHVQCLPSHIKTVNQPHLGACNFTKAGLMTVYVCLGMTSYVGCSHITSFITVFSLFIYYLFIFILPYKAFDFRFFFVYIKTNSKLFISFHPISKLISECLFR